MRKVWPWLLVIAAALVCLALLFIAAPDWLRALVGGVSAAGAVLASLWGGREITKPEPVEVSSSEPHDLAAAEADRQVADLDAFARADTAEAHADADGYPDALLRLKGQPLADELGRIMDGGRPPGAPVPRPMPGHGADYTGG